MSPHCHLYLLIIQQGSATISTLITGWKVFEQLIVLCKELNLVSEVDSCAVMPLPCDLLAHNNASNSLNLKSSKVPEDQELIDATQ